MQKRGDRGAILLSGVIVFSALAMWDGSARSQTVLPAITVAASTPIARRTPARPSAPIPPPADAGKPSALEPALPGTLPIVTDQFATVTVVPNEELRRTTGATLGDVLFSKPGITGSSFAPGAASRPIVRGLDSYRVRIQENGVNASGVSELGEDHGLPLDPLGIDQLEVVRGPATLRWGSQAIGGVVNATNNRIPETLPCRDDAPLRVITKSIPVNSDRAPCALLQTRSAVATVDNGVEGATLLDAGHGNFAIHADGYGRRADDYLIPGYPYLFPPEPPPIVNGRQPNSAMRSQGASLGGSYVFDGGFVGFAVAQFNSMYRIPGFEATQTNTRIDLRQTKLTSKGEYRPQFSPIEVVRYWAGVTDYKHREFASENGLDGVQQAFTSKEQESRVEVQLTPFNLPLATLTSTLGVQAAHQRLTSPGVEGGLFDPNRTRSVAGFMFNELQFSETLRMQVAGRLEQANVTGSAPDLFIEPNIVIPRNRNFAPKSLAIGFLQDLPWDTVASVTAQHMERAPRAPELFSRGRHEATGTFDIGNPSLAIEAARTVELSLRRAKGPFRFEATVFYTHFNGFIFRRLTGETCDGDFASCTPAGPGGGLNQAVYSQRDANFRGGEFQSQLDVAPLWDGVFGVENQFDVVRATFTAGGNVPRIPPVRVGGGVFWHDAHWLARVNLLHAFPQNNIAAMAETPTGGYNLLKAEVTYTTRLPPGDFLGRELTLGVVGNNLLNNDIRNSVSFRKNEVLLPGANVRLFANFTF